MFQKYNPIRSRKLLDKAEGESCIRCGINDGTIVAAHYSGIMAHQIGKGKGIKVDDLATAELCSKCHLEMDSYENGNDYERATEFLIMIMKTLNRRWYRGDFK